MKTESKNENNDWATVEIKYRRNETETGTIEKVYGHSSASVIGMLVGDSFLRLPFRGGFATQAALMALATVSDVDSLGNFNDEIRYAIKNLIRACDEFFLRLKSQAKLTSPTSLNHQTITRPHRK